MNPNGRPVAFVALLVVACSEPRPALGPVDRDGDGVTDHVDCDAVDPEAGGVEVPYDGRDNDCDPKSPDDDLDGDGFGRALDCDDLDDRLHPAATERTDAIDNDCDGALDCDDIDLTVWDGDVRWEDVPDVCASVCPRVVEGRVILAPPPGATLFGLDCLTAIDGDLELVGGDLGNLRGLDALTRVGGSVSVVDGPFLRSVEGLDQLTEVGGSLTLSGLPALGSLSGLGELRSASALIAAECDLLVSLEGAPNLEYVGPGGVEVSDNASLRSVSALGSAALEGPITVVRNATLTSLDGLGRATLGSVTLEDNGSLTSLAGLASVQVVEGDLVVRSHEALTSLDGLEGLTAVTGDLTLEDLPALSSVRALSRLGTVDGTLAFVDVRELVSLSGLDALTTVGGLVVHYGGFASLAGLGSLGTIQGDFTVYGSTIASLEGLDSLSSVDGSVELTLVRFATGSLTGLEALTNIGGDLRIRGMSGVDSLTGLDNLTWVGGDLELGDPGYGVGWALDNVDLATLDGLQALDTIGGDLTIRSQWSLDELTTLHGLTSVTGDVSIIDNLMLSNADGGALVTQIESIGGVVTVSSNLGWEYGEPLYY